LHASPEKEPFRCMCAERCVPPKRLPWPPAARPPV
jgi:hypothetical protein